MAQQNQNQQQAGQRNTSQADVNSRPEKDFSSSSPKTSTSTDKTSQDSKQWSQTGTRDQGSGFQQQGQQDSTARQAPTTKK